MREILFRGKQLTDDEWVWGSLFIEDGLLNNGKTYILTSISLNAFTEVDPETVGQFTGFLDKFDKRVFEGDIVRIDSGIPMRVTLENGFWQLLAQSGTWGTVWTNMDGAEIIGNVCDTPELLGGKSYAD